MKYSEELETIRNAVKSAYCKIGGKRITANAGCLPNNAIVSFGEYSHTDPQIAKMQHDAVFKVYNRIAKMRIFGAAA